MQVSTCFYYPYFRVDVKRVEGETKFDLDRRVSITCATSAVGIESQNQDFLLPGDYFEG
jgi:hypothetical protein